MNQTVVYAYLRQNKSKLNDLLGRLSTDLIEIGRIPIEASVIGNKESWRLISSHDAAALARETQQNLDYTSAPAQDRTSTQAYLKFHNDLSPDFSLAFEPLLTLWSRGANQFRFERMNTYHQILMIEQYTKELQKIEFLAYNALTIAVDENLGQLRYGEQKINTHLRHYESKLTRPNKLKEEEIPKIKQELVTQQLTDEKIAIELEQHRLLIR